MAFPETSVLDDFSRSDRTLNGDGIWASGNFWQYTVDPWSIAGNEAQGHGANWSDVRTTASHSRTAQDGLEVYWTVRDYDGTLNAYWCIANPGTGSLDGYLFRSNNGGVYRLDDETETQLGARFTLNWVTGDRHGVSHDSGGTITVYEDTGSGWSSLGTRSDATYAAGYLGLESEASANVDDFGGGEYAATGKSGTAAISGGGTLNASARKGARGAAVLPGGGALAGVEQKGGRGDAPISGGGALSASASKGARGAVALAGGGSLTATGWASAPAFGTAAISGGGALAVAGAAARYGTATLPGGGLLVAVGGAAVDLLGDVSVSDAVVGAASVRDAAVGAAAIRDAAVGSTWLSDGLVSDA